MKRLVLANSDYRLHTTDEGEQLQEGLRAAGWTLAGYGYGDDDTDVRSIMDKHRPELVLVQAREDWDRDSAGCFDPRVSFKNISALKDAPCTTVCVVKDAPMGDRQQRWCEEAGADAVLLYYHPQSVARWNPWIENYRVCRTYHSVETGVCRRVLAARDGSRKRGLVSGQVSQNYPTRSMAVSNAKRLGLDYHRHPGYCPNGRGCYTSGYLAKLAGYKVHVACSSRYAFALRKIIESVAVGCTPVTDLPHYDKLPVIDDALVRIPAECGVDDIEHAIDYAESTWNLAERKRWASDCWAYYGWRDTGLRLSSMLDGLCGTSTRSPS